MPPRSKSSAKTDSSQASQVLLEAGYTRRTTKRLRVDSDDEDGNGYEPQQERRTSYNESFTRGGARGSSPPAKGKRRKVSATVASGSDDGEESDYDARTEDYSNSRREEEEEEEEEAEEEENSGRADSTEEIHDARDEQQDDDEDDNGRTGGRLSKKPRGSIFSLFTWSDSPPSPAHRHPMVPYPSIYTDSNIGGRTRRPSSKAKQMATGTSTTSTSTAKKSKGKRKPQVSESTRNSRSRKEVAWSEGESEEEYNGHEDEEVNVDEDEEEDEARLTDDYDVSEEERPARGKKGRGAKGGKGREKGADMAPILKKAKFEGNPAASSTTATTAGTKRSRGKKVAGEDTIVDIMDEYGTPDPSSIGSPTATTATDGGKDDTPASSAPPAKKRKLPTIKKVKTAASLGAAGSGSSGTGPSTPVSGSATGGKPPVGLPPPQSGGIAGSGVSILGIAETKARPKTNMASDLDLSNPSLYAELFKNPGGNASRTGLNRRAKEEERKKELDKMKEEYKIQFAEESKKSFDLQGQAEKMARFEEVLRQRRSSALYPNFLAAKWREEWEREKRRAQRRDYQPPPSHPNGHVDDTKEEGEM
ncbi:hypothetical protein NP233_g13018 [Leucocoprinus birnbaumii]|uniref:Uncharacterized protein n=1 Tax=Leucocoprinus birnbaumii TaxID=56174 RepID=A0AAD5YPE3_9AGAR|nr:hypothetical protein NP233_g13018 [Leucocoprinus birnbaumii]